MSSMNPFSDHHVQLDFIFCPSCLAWFYFLFIMSSLVIFFVPSPHIMPSQGAQTTLGATPCQSLSSLSSQSQPKDLFSCILACTPTHKVFHEYHNTHPHPAHGGLLTHTAGQINDPIQVLTDCYWCPIQTVVSRAIIFTNGILITHPPPCRARTVGPERLILGRIYLQGYPRLFV